MTLFLDNLTVILGFLTLQDKYNVCTHIVGKYKIHLNSLGNRTEKLAKGSKGYK
jgi:hypothetical protein